MQVTLDIPAKRIRDLMVTAIEGGTSYWCEAVLLENHGKVQLARCWYDTVDLYDEPLLTIKVVEREESVEGAGTDHIIGRDSIKEGLRKMATECGSHFGDFMAENEDATTADVFLQCVALGEVVYG